MQASLKLLAFDLISKEVQQLGKLVLSGSQIELPQEYKYLLSPSLILLVNFPLIFFEKFSKELSRATFKILRLEKNSNALELLDMSSCSTETLIKELVEHALSS